MCSIILSFISVNIIYMLYHAHFILTPSTSCYLLYYCMLYFVGDLTRHQDQNKSSVSKEATHIVMVSIYILTESYTIIHYNKAVINWF